MFLWMWLACQDDQSLASISMKSSPLEVVENLDRPPLHLDSSTHNLLQGVQQDASVLSHFKSCLIESESNSSKWFFYAWNPDGTVGLVVGIHGLLPEQMQLNQTRSLKVATRDVFLMVEVGENIPINFCTSTVQEIPIATVLESKLGQVKIKRTEDGWSLAIGEVRYVDQYSNTEWKMPSMLIPSQIVERF